MGEGAVQTILGDANWNTAPVNGLPDNEFFADPMAGKGQPPVPTGLPDHPVPGGIIAGSLFPNNPTVLPPGHYYATTPSLPILGLRTPTGLPVVITGNVVFSDGSPGTTRANTSKEGVARYGLGVEWQFMKNAGMRLEWERLADVGKAFAGGVSGSTGEADQDAYTIGVVFRF
jgi:hypothetical protein